MCGRTLQTRGWQTGRWSCREKNEWLWIRARGEKTRRMWISSSAKLFLHWHLCSSVGFQLMPKSPMMLLWLFSSSDPLWHAVMEDYSSVCYANTHFIRRKPLHVDANLQPGNWQPLNSAKMELKPHKRVSLNLKQESSSFASCFFKQAPIRDSARRFLTDHGRLASWIHSKLAAFSATPSVAAGA